MQHHDTVSKASLWNGTHTHTRISRLGARSLLAALYIVGLCSDLFGGGQITALNTTSSVNINGCTFITSLISFVWWFDLTIIDIVENMMQLSFLLTVTVFELRHLPNIWVYCKSFLPWINSVAFVMNKYIGHQTSFKLFWFCLSNCLSEISPLKKQ